MKKAVLLYSALVVGAVVLVSAMLRVGGRLETPRRTAAAAVAATVGSSVDTTGAGARGESAAPRSAWSANLRQPLAVLMLQMLAILLTAQCCGAAVWRLRQPRVVGEIAAGLLLGPSLLGLLLPDVSRALFPPASLPPLQLLSQLGVTLFMFGVGLNVNPGHLRGRAHAAVAVSHASILVPFTLGVLLSLLLYEHYAGDGVAFRSFALFMGVGMSITAFPVLACIIEERRLTNTPLASMALTCAAVDDVTAWVLLAYVVALVTSAGAWERLGATMAMTGGFVAFMTGVARPCLRRWFAARADAGGVRPSRAALALAWLLASALVTEAIGIHALFGAFVSGAVLPAGADVRERLRERIDGLSGVILLPVFFALTGLRTNLALLHGAASWLVCAGIVGIATAGKLGGGMLAARVAGIGWRGAFTLGALMNTRGLMELVALNLGYELGVLSPEIFAMMVLMAMVTTVMTGPLLDLVAIGAQSTDVAEGASALGPFVVPDAISGR